MILSDSFACRKFCAASAGTTISYVHRCRFRMIMSEKPNDGTVAMLYGDADEGDFYAVEGYLPTVPTTVSFTRHIVV